jgi:hypothetical protein
VHALRVLVLVLAGVVLYFVILLLPLDYIVVGAAVVSAGTLGWCGEASCLLLVQRSQSPAKNTVTAVECLPACM